MSDRIQGCFQMIGLVFLNISSCFALQRCILHEILKKVIFINNITVSCHCLFADANCKELCKTGQSYERRNANLSVFTSHQKIPKAQSADNLSRTNSSLFTVSEGYSYSSQISTRPYIGSNLCSNV